MRKGLTLMELLTVISILATLAALLFPVYQRVMKRVYVTNCANQLRQIGLAFRIYAHDCGDDTPYALHYAEKLYPHYISDERVLVCPYFAVMAPEVVKEMHTFSRQRWGTPWSSYNVKLPRALDDIARKYPDEQISFAEMYSVLGDRIPIAYCIVHRIGCPYGLGRSPKGREFCVRYCINPNVLAHANFEKINPTFIFLLCPTPPGLLSDLSQPWIVLRWDGSVYLDYGGGWQPDTAEREFLEKVSEGK